MAEDKKQYAKKIELGVGLHMFGNRISMQAVPNRITLEITSLGVICCHLEQRKSILIPYANIKGMEIPFYTEDGQVNSLAPVKQLPPKK